MLSTLFLVLRLTLFVDQCDDGVCAVYGGIYDEDDVGPIYVPQASLPACAREGALIQNGRCIEPRPSPDCTRKSTDRTPVTVDNYFDAAKGLYWYCSDWHGGQNSELYGIMSARLDYHPAMSERGPDSDDESGDFYAELQGGGWDATELCAAIDLAYKAAH